MPWTIGLAAAFDEDVPSGIDRPAFIAANLCKAEAALRLVGIHNEGEM